MKYQIVILGVFLISLCRCAIEWPVFFEHLGFVHSIHNKWDLTVSVKLHLPSLEARLSKTVHRLRLLDHQYEIHESDNLESSTATTTSDSTTSRNQVFRQKQLFLNYQLKIECTKVHKFEHFNLQFIQKLV
jgi:hypothetical protein